MERAAVDRTGAPPAPPNEEVSGTRSSARGTTARRGRWTTLWVLVSLAAVVGFLGPSVEATGGTHQIVGKPDRGRTGFPARPAGLAVCGTALLLSPYSHTNDHPLGTTTKVVTIPAGADTGSYGNPNTTYYFAPGLHTLGTSSFAQIDTGANDWYVGEYSRLTGGAILNGHEENQYGFVNSGTTADTYEYLTVEGFTTYGLGGSALASGGAAPDQTYAYITAEYNYPGSGLDLGSDSSLTHSCLANDGDYGFNVYCTGAGCDESALTGGPQNLVVEHDEISFNDVCNYGGTPAAYWPGPSRLPPGCGNTAGSCPGCDGGVKFWETDRTVFEDNYVHNNYDDGAWWDTDNDGAVIEGNYFSDNFGEGVIYEISYNAKIEDNNFVNNAWGMGECGAASGNPCDDGGNLAPAIYISESGASSAVGLGGFNNFTISGNDFTNNWDGVYLAESANRFCSSPDNTSTGNCTIGPEKTAFWDQRSSDTPTVPYYDKQSDTKGGCGRADLTGATPSQTPDYYDNCDWRTQDVFVTQNSFNFDASVIPGCSRTSGSPCGENGIASVVATDPSWNPYIATPGGTPGWSVIDRITNCRSGTLDTGDLTYRRCVPQNNWFSENTYTYSGPQNWRFNFANQGVEVSLRQWQGYGQDARSTFQYR